MKWRITSRPARPVRTRIAGWRECEILTVDDWEEDDTKGAKSCSVDTSTRCGIFFSLAILPFGGEVTLMRSPRFLIGSNVRLPILLMTVLIITTRAPRRKRFCTTSEMAGMVAALDPLSSSTRQAICMARPLREVNMGTEQFSKLTPKAGVGWSEKILYNFK